MEKYTAMSPISRLMSENKKFLNCVLSFHSVLYEEMVELTNEKVIEENYLIVNDMHLNSISKKITSSSNAKIYKKVFKRRSLLVARLGFMKLDLKKFKMLRKSLKFVKHSINAAKLLKEIENLENIPDSGHEVVEECRISVRETRRKLQTMSEYVALVYTLFRAPSFRPTCFGRKQEDENRWDENRLDEKWIYRFRPIWSELFSSRKLSECDIY